jgi:hypothetical protein
VAGPLDAEEMRQARAVAVAARSPGALPRLGGYLAPLGRVPWRRVLAEAAVMVSPLVVSDLLGRLALSSEQVALGHAAQTARLENALGLDVEHWFSAALGAHPTLHAVATGYYATVHFAGTALAALALAVARPASFARMRTAFLVASSSALLISRLWPLMPPNLAGPDIGLVGTVLPASHPPNAYAAMPSLHTVWALWTAAALVVAARGAPPAWRSTAAALGATHVAATVAIVLGLGHHFLADVLAGIAVATVGAGVAGLPVLRRARRPRAG